MKSMYPKRSDLPVCCFVVAVLSDTASSSRRHANPISLGVIVLGLLFSFSSFAIVDGVTRSFQVTHLDTETEDGLYSLRRHYHSKRQQSGWFGLSMCSVFESQILESNGDLYFQYCGGGAVLPLDGSYGMKVEKKNGQSLVRTRRYSYLFDRNDRLRRIYFRERIVYDITHQKDKKRIRGPGFSWLLTFKGGVVISLSDGKNQLNYSYGSEDQLLEVKRNKKKRFAYQWKNNRLVEYRSFDGNKKRVSYNTRGEVEQVTSDDCNESLKPAREGRLTYTLVTRKCKGQRAKTKKIMVSGRDKKFNYKVIEIENGKKAELEVRNGYLASKLQNGNRYVYDYDNSGRIQRMQMNEVLLTVKDRDQFHAKSILISSMKKPEQSIANLNLKWVKNELVSYRLLDKEWRFQNTKYGQRISSPQYRLSLLKRGRQVFVKGMWRGDQLKPFRVDRGPASLTPHQRQVADEIINQDRFRKALGGL